MPGSDRKPMLVRTPTGDTDNPALDQQLVSALCAAELDDVREKADSLKCAFRAAVPHLVRVDQLCRISLQKPWIASFQDYRRLLSASNSLATKTVRFLHTYIHVYLPLILDRTMPEAEKIHELQMFLKHEDEAPPADVAARADKIRADIRKVHARLEAVAKSRTGGSDPVLAAAEAHIQALQRYKEWLTEKIERLLYMVPSAMAHSVAHWASVRIIIGKEGVSRAAVPVVVGLKATRDRTFSYLYFLEPVVKQPRATDEDPLHALRPCVFAVAGQLEALGPRLESFGRIQPMILEHVANYISLAERAREHCGTTAEMEMRKRERTMHSAAEGYATLADALEEYACSG